MKYIQECRTNKVESLCKVEPKVNKTIVIFHTLPNVFPQSVLLTICKSFIRLHFDYGNIIYNKAFNKSFHAKLDSIQYKVIPAITAAIKQSSTENIYEELDLDLKIKTLLQNKGNQLPYILNTISTSNIKRQTKTRAIFPLFFVEHDCFKNSFFFLL